MYMIYRVYFLAIFTVFSYLSSIYEMREKMLCVTNSNRIRRGCYPLFTRTTHFQRRDPIVGQEFACRRTFRRVFMEGLVPGEEYGRKVIPTRRRDAHFSGICARTLVSIVVSPGFHRRVSSTPTSTLRGRLQERFSWWFIVLGSVARLHIVSSRSFSLPVTRVSASDLQFRNVVPFPRGQSILRCSLASRKL